MSKGLGALAFRVALFFIGAIEAQIYFAEKLTVMFSTVWRKERVLDVKRL
jgi:hypothetical protein